MNILAGVDDYNSEIFRSSANFKPVTTGVDLSKKFMSLKEFSKLNDNPEVDSNVLVGFIDTEGQGSKFIASQHFEHDLTIYEKYNKFLCNSF